MLKFVILGLCLGAVLGAIVGGVVFARRASAPRYAIASTVSEPARRALKPIYATQAARPPIPMPRSAAGWDRLAAIAEKTARPSETARAAEIGVQTAADVIGGVRVVRIRPNGAVKSDRVLIYAHGGAYVVLSAHSMLTIPALMARATGLEVVSVDYTLAPKGTWTTTPDQVLAVYAGLRRSGFSPHAIGLFGDSAGGGLVAGSVLKMRDDGVPLPGALVLMSPWTDLRAVGDTYATLAPSDPTLSPRVLQAAADAYAKGHLAHPYVSPALGDYTKPFPPTLIQAGTRELLLSGAVRQYRAIRAGGQEAELDLYEGMPHVFQARLPQAPETTAAITIAAQWFNARLRPEPN